MKVLLTYDDVQIVPKYSEVASRKFVATRTRLVDDIYIYHPLIPANMDSISSVEMMKTANKCGSICFLHRFNNINTVIEYITNGLHDISPIGFSIGVGPTGVSYAKHILERIRMFNETSKVVFLLDVAHAHHLNVQETLALYYKSPDLSNIPIIAGNVSTPLATKFLIEHGARGVKCGQGNGCFVGDMMIKTNIGYKKISDINVGDFVYSHTGKMNEVINLFSRETNELITVNDEIKCTPNHEFYAVHENDVNKVNENNIHEYAKWKKAEDLTSEWHLIKLE